MANLAQRALRRIRKDAAQMAANRLPASCLPRPKGRIFDCFMLYREVELLEIRLNELYEEVDVFVILESCKSFTGKPNRPVFPLHAERLAKFRDKIRYIVVEEVPDSAYESNPMTPDTATCEFWQRRQLLRGLSDARDEDMIVYSDADEIPTFAALRRAGLLLDAGERLVLLLQSWRLLYFDGLVDVPWRGTGVTTRHKLREVYQDNFNELWFPRWTQTEVALVRDGGWHISFLGEAAAIRDKMSAAGHPGMQKEFLDALRNKTFNGWKFEPRREASLPRFVRDQPERWQSLMYSDSAYNLLCEDLIKEPFAGHVSS